MAPASHLIVAPSTSPRKRKDPDHGRKDGSREEQVQTAPLTQVARDSVGVDGALAPVAVIS